MSDFEQFREEIADAIESALILEGDEYKFDVDDATEAVLDVLERRHILIVMDEN